MKFVKRQASFFIDLMLQTSSTVYFYYRRWQKWGVWEEMNHRLRDAVRQQKGKSIQPTAIIADSQSVKTAEKRGRSMALTVAKPSRDVSVK